jgi:hypothetical protein
MAGAVKAGVECCHRSTRAGDCELEQAIGLDLEFHHA